MTLVEPSMPIAQKLRELRLANKYTLQQLATVAGLSISAITQIEYGVNLHPRLDTLKKLARALGVSLDDLAANDDDGPAPPKPRRPRKKK
jgi:transcriptional regulator with XRE-family HTH domain